MGLEMMYCSICGVQMTEWYRDNAIRYRVDVGFVSPSDHGGIICVNCTKKYRLQRLHDRIRKEEGEIRK